MGVIIKSSIKTTFISYIGVALGALITIFIMPELLSPEEIGAYRYVVDMGVFLGTILQFGAANLADRYFPKYAKENKSAAFVKFLMLYPAPILSLFIIVFIFGKGFFVDSYLKSSPMIGEYIVYIIPLMILVLYRTILEAVSRASLRVSRPAFYRELLLRVASIVFLFLFYLKWIDLGGFILLTTFAYLANMLLLVYDERDLVLSKGGVLKPQRPEVKHFLTFSMYMFLGGAGSLLVNKIDILMIPYFSSAASLGVYATCFYMAAFIEIPKRALTQISLPILSKAFEHNDTEEIMKIYSKSSITQLIIGAFLFLMIWVNVDFIFHIMPNGKAFEEGKLVILFIGLSKVVDLLFGMNSELLYFSKYYKYNYWFNVLLAFFMFLFNYLLIPQYGISGAAFATLLSVVILNTIRLIFLKRVLSVWPFDKNTLIAFALISMIALISLWINIDSIMLQFLMRSLVISLLFYLAVKKTNVSIDLKELLSNIERMILNKIYGRKE
ncbi:lipopolysaccharide biosynthesis protein [Aureibacter tunicatorum]|uniref:O-antigen/teichoic acid export membrane protein n=1 Tax=Aureibacter tunicatorum TaxID=866807 RepID=A0AAE4BT26_9BACT|nr:oligosaccharide flippase family protein [Aureibacter tunicatorum]MDR6239052.1 O-antigen/teichoic acid export membrane protein [Aureibacter tunicatorum]BDD05022.1 hypothetical protein AUTU_25050 [Aureibacter tunicatorum]